VAAQLDTEGLEGEFRQTPGSSVDGNVIAQPANQPLSRHHGSWGWTALRRGWL